MATLEYPFPCSECNRAIPEGCPPFCVGYEQMQRTRLAWMQASGREISEYLEALGESKSKERGCVDCTYGAGSPRKNYMACALDTKTYGRYHTCRRWEARK